jgi:hypothetical protein
MARSASPFAIRYSPFTSHQHAQPFCTRKNNMTNFDIFEENHQVFKLRRPSRSALAAMHPEAAER